MTLADLKKLSIRKKIRIHFRVSGSMECIITEHGLARVPGLTGPTDLRLEDELARADQFLIEPATEEKQRRSEHLSREQMLALAVARPQAANPDHGEEE